MPVRREKDSYLICIPKALAEALELDGKYVEFQLAGKGRLTLLVHESDRGTQAHERNLKAF